MPSDFKNSYEQLSWEHALESHARTVRCIARYMEFLEQSSMPEKWAHIIDGLKADLARYEAKYPQLKVKNTDG